MLNRKGADRSLSAPFLFIHIRQLIIPYTNWNTSDSCVQSSDSIL